MAHHHHSYESHRHAHRHGPVPAKGTRTYTALVAGIALNLLFVIVEAGVGFRQVSLALLSDAGHNLFDVASLAMALLAFRLARVKPNDNFTYGFRKTTILVALLNAVILLVAIGGIGIEAIGRILHPQALAGSAMAIVAAAGIFINGFTAWLFLEERDRDLNMKAAYLHMAADALVSLGVVVSGLLIMWMRWYWLDPAISFVIMIVILLSTWRLLKDSIRLSLDGVPREVDMEAVRQAARETPGILDVHHVHVWGMSTTQNALTAHLVVSSGLELAETEGIKDNLRKRLKKLHINHSTFELETEEEACREKNCVHPETAGKPHVHPHS